MNFIRRLTWEGPVADLIFSDAELAALYDRMNPSRADVDLRRSSGENGVNRGVIEWNPAVQDEHRQAVDQGPSL